MRITVFAAVAAFSGACSAWAADQVAPQPAPAAAPAGIVVYDQPNFHGHALTLAQATPDLAKLNFDDRVASLVISGGGEWVLCENRNYAGRCIRVSTKAEDLKLLQLAGRVSSLYPVPATATPAPVTNP